jgi:hypothetical protein
MRAIIQKITAELEASEAGLQALQLLIEEGEKQEHTDAARKTEIDAELFSAKEEQKRLDTRAQRARADVQAFKDARAAAAAEAEENTPREFEGVPLPTDPSMPEVGAAAPAPAPEAPPMTEEEQAEEQRLEDGGSLCLIRVTNWRQCLALRATKRGWRARRWRSWRRSCATWSSGWR